MRQTLLLSLLVLFVVQLTGCDSSFQADITRNQDHIEAARSWFDAQTASLGKSGDDALRRFYPDWDKGILVTTADGQQAMVTTLWRDYTVTYDSSLYFLRTLAVLLDSEGAVEQGHIVEFSSPDFIASEDGPALVQQWLAGSFGYETISVLERSVTYEFEQGFLHVSGQEPVELTLEVKDCTVGSGKAMATMQCEEVGFRYEHTICVADKCTDYYSIYYQCWEDNGGGGGGGGSGEGGYGGSGSGGPGSGDSGYNAPTTADPQTTADQTRSEIKEQCPGVTSDATANNIFQGSTRHSFNMLYSQFESTPYHTIFQYDPSRKIPNTINPADPRDLDGFAMTGNRITAILEVKNTSSLHRSEYNSQIRDQIAFLSTQRITGSDFAPTLFLVSQASQSHYRLAEWASFANSRGVNLVHFNLRQGTSGSELYFRGGYIGNTMSGSGVGVPWWVNMMTNLITGGGNKKVDLSIGCTKSEK